MPSPFEDPRKTEMRERFQIALDGAGHKILDEPVPVSLPSGSELRGAIVGDVQSLDGDQVRYAFFLRPESGKPLPQWLANIARAALQTHEVCVYIVVTEVSAIMERTCRACGAGLLQLTVENTVERIIEFGDIDPVRRRAEFAQKAKELRRRLETKLNLNIKSFESNFARVSELTQGMPAEKRDQYIRDVEEADRRWRDWGENISARLDEVQASQDEDELRAIERRISEGALSDSEQ
jgi:hypothetical protein